MIEVSEVLPPFVGEGRLHLDRVEVYYSIEGDDRARRLTIDLKPDDRIAAIYFDRDDALRCLGFRMPEMTGYPANTERMEVAGGATIDVLDERLEQRSAKEIYIHQKDCRWIYER